MRWAEASNVDLGSATGHLMEVFGSRSSGETAFDALLGLPAMIEVVDGRRPEMSTFVLSEAPMREGWILGR